MYKKIITVFIIILSLFCIGTSVFAAVDVKEERGEKGYSQGLVQKDNWKNFPLLKGWEIGSRVSELFGVDNNVYLNPERRSSEFWQTMWNVDLSKDLNDAFKAKIDYQFLNDLYTHAKTATFYKNTIGGGFETKSLGRFTIVNNYHFDWVKYLHEETGDYFGYRTDIGIKEKISQRLYHQLSYEFLYKDYRKSVIEDTNGVLEDTEKLRQDVRNTVNYEVGRYFNKSLVKFFYNFYNNDSNYKYQNYYTYDSHKIGGSLTYLFNKKFSGYISLVHQWKFYKDRGTVADVSITADDKTYIFNSSLFYKLSKQATAALSYAYRENHSREPSQKYSGSVITGGIYYKF